MRFLNWMLPQDRSRGTAQEKRGAAAQLFQVVLLCKDDYGLRLEQQLRHELAARDLSLQRLRTRQCDRRELVEMRVLVHCQPGGRPGMVKLVQRLGLEPLVRAVRWETVPQPERALAAA
ncbi:hypothetical protein P3W85_42805 [Cupriavidus basilensis]|uniref:MgtC-like C-terminal domain-containing protein n=1 Tax=Cupriavidus basilensis TaxID=68895 RepID=A0ABT6B4U9_9BURK|nr:hypothetical protein [Cupriavidus basilensis]MDF3839623.1 hypothetical protein [Cupriavidus basilensis]